MSDLKPTLDQLRDYIIVRDHEKAFETIVELRKKCDRLEACCEKLAGALWPITREYREGLYFQAREIENQEIANAIRSSAVADKADQALAEYRAMRDQTEMPCPDKDIDPLG